MLRKIGILIGIMAVLKKRAILKNLRDLASFIKKGEKNG
jgi:hypothetical protein